MWSLPAEGDVGGAALRHVGRHLVGELETTQVLPQALATVEQDRGDRDMQVVDEPGAQEVAGGADPTAHAHVQAAGGFGRLGEDVLDRGAAEVEGRSPLHRE